jgi:hypothetical protein
MRVMSLGVMIPVRCPVAEYEGAPVSALGEVCQDARHGVAGRGPGVPALAAH